jgi:N-formylglutamate amidohydrolase
MNFKEEINELEQLDLVNIYKISMGNVPILFTAPHTMKQVRSDGTVKSSEPYTKAIALYLNKHMNTYSMIKLQDTGLDSNRDNHDEFKTKLLNLVDEHNIKLVIDLHGASESRDFDVEFGTMNNLTADFSTINELKEAFIENGITKISFNNPFKGGAITQYLYNKKDIDVIQLEINYRYRDYSNLDNLELLIKALSAFIKQYKDYIER